MSNGKIIKDFQILYAYMICTLKEKSVRLIFTICFHIYSFIFSLFLFFCLLCFMVKCRMEAKMSKNHKPCVLLTPLTSQICENPMNSFELHFPSYLIKNIDNMHPATFSLIFLTFWGSWIKGKDYIEVVAPSLSSWTCYRHHWNQQIITINPIC